MERLQFAGMDPDHFLAPHPVGGVCARMIPLLEIADLAAQQEVLLNREGRDFIDAGHELL